MDDVPRLGLGTYQNDDHDQCAESVRTALDAGYRNLDTAQGYENERAVGEGLADSAVAREDVFLASKVQTDSLSYEDTLSSTRESAENLGVDTIDLQYVHWPLNTYDPEATLPALDELREEGTIEHVGLSNFRPDQLDEANDHLDAPIFAHQVEMHPLLQQEELHEYALEDDHLLVAYCPIARGKVNDVDVIRDVAERHDVTPVQVSLAWLLGKENVVAIPKATGEDHIRENYAALDVELDDEDVAAIESIEREERLVEFDDAPWNQV
ncbi:aldo/keto reductase [Halomarina oriensis]|uniref:Aldo/keto reductase n=1 Tax=Halomarina oriensis TaxID=671145 RepID=A0A6B0GX99_9EURY|nr:aldo/keto reductase [Halomarina oriensis]MWG36388.1 aldo/keto reductase [Halomarina oriensis]